MRLSSPVGLRPVARLGALAALGAALLAAAGEARAQSGGADPGTPAWLRGSTDGTTGGTTAGTTAPAWLRGGGPDGSDTPGLRGTGGADAANAEGGADMGSSRLRGSVDLADPAPSTPADLFRAADPSGESAAESDVLPGVEAPLDRLELPGDVPTLAERARRPRRVRAAEDDPFAPVGFRAGSFVVRPYAELRAGYDSNALREPGGAGSAFTAVEGGFLARSDWSRHALDIELRGGYTRYEDVAHNNRPEADATMRGRIDVSSLSRIDVVVRGAITTQAAGSVDAPTGVEEPPLVYETGVDVGYTQVFNRFEATVAGIIAREDYAPAELIGGGTESLTDQNVTGYGLRLRGAYELMPGVKPFVQAVADRRVYDVVPDSQGLDRGSKGLALTAGSEFRLSELLTGTASAGYLWREYDDPQLENIGGFVFDAALIWQASGLTTVTLTALGTVAETTYADASGDFVHEVGVEIEHAFRRWLIGNVSVAYRIDDYEGSGLTQRTLTVGGGLTYKLGRWAELTGEVSHLRLDSSIPGDDYTANVVTVGLRLQR